MPESYHLGAGRKGSPPSEIRYDAGIIQTTDSDAKQMIPTKEKSMSKLIEHVHWPGAPDLWMPYAPAIKVTGGTTVYFAGVTAAPVYHHHPHRPEEFDIISSLASS